MLDGKESSIKNYFGYEFLRIKGVQSCRNIKIFEIVIIVVGIGWE